MLARLLDTAYGHVPVAPGARQEGVAGPRGPTAHVLDDIASATRIIGALAGAGFDTKSLSLLVRVSRTEDRAMGFHAAGDRLRSCDGANAFWGGFWKLLRTPAVFVLPGVGLVALAGPLVPALVSELAGAVVVDGTSALDAALRQLGVSAEQVIACENALLADQVVLLVLQAVRDEFQPRTAS